MQNSNKNNKIIRPGDLAPKGVKSTYLELVDGKRVCFNKAFEHLYKHIRMKGGANV